MGTTRLVVAREVEGPAHEGEAMPVLVLLGVEAAVGPHGVGVASVEDVDGSDDVAPEVAAAWKRGLELTSAEEEEAYSRYEEEAQDRYEAAQEERAELRMERESGAWL